MARAIVKNLGQPVKNYVINGGMQVAQRGVVNAANNSFLYGGADRFAVGPFFSASSGGQIAQQTFTTGVLTQQMQAVVSLNNTGAGSVQFYTRLESKDVTRLNGKTVTWSMLAYQTSGLTLQFGCEINRPTTTADNYGSLTSVNSFTATPVPTHTLTRVTYTYTFSAAAAEKGLELRSFFAVPSTLSNVGYYIGEMQLEESSYRSTLEVNPFEVEFAKCQRYYHSKTDVTRIGFTESFNFFCGEYIGFPVEMRTTPVIFQSAQGVAGRFTRMSSGQVINGTTTPNANSHGIRYMLSSTALPANNVAYSFDYTADAEL